jgi:hypothetical protein
MVLSAERKISLEDRYEVWGLDEVRKELERPDRDQFINPDVTAFGQAWVEAKEASIQRRKRAFEDNPHNRRPRPARSGHRLDPGILTQEKDWFRR